MTFLIFSPRVMSAEDFMPLNVVRRILGMRALELVVYEYM